jgi:PIN domain nuclease of toxin-antitoxin system
MNLLLDTQLLLWSAFQSSRLRRQARELLEDPANEVAFSVASLWETSIKYSLDRKDFPFDPRRVRSAALAMGFKELGISSEHTFQTTQLPHLHKDPFDRLLIAQAVVENLTLITTDKKVARYPGAIQRV